MNIKLFNELHTFLQEKFPQGELTKDDFLYYLLGNDSTDMNTKISAIPYTPSRIYNQGQKIRSIFKETYKTILELSKRLRLDDLILHYFRNYPKTALQIKEAILSDDSRIRKIYEDCSITMPDDGDIEHLLLHLFTECITEKRPHCFASYKKQQIKPSTAKSILGRDNDIVELSKALKQYHKIIISDQYGAGKSSFINSYLYKATPQDYCYVDYQGSLTLTLKTIKFLDDSGIECTHSSHDDLMDPAFKSSLLIIDNMYVSPDFSQELGLLASFAVKVIVITACDIHHKSFYDFKMSQLSVSDLQGIFEHASDMTLKDGHVRAQLFNLTQRNVLMVSLIAGQCKELAKHPDNSDQPSDILGDFLSSLGIYHAKPKRTSPENKQKRTSSEKCYKHAEKKADFFGHVKYVYTHFFDSYPGYEKERELLKNLCYFGCSPIPLIFLQKVLPVYDRKTLTTLSDMGLLILTEESILLTPLISFAVNADINDSSTEDTSRHRCLCDNMTAFLRDYDLTLSIPYVPDILAAFAKKLYRNVKITNNSKQKKASTMFEERQELMYMIFSYYNQNGDATYSSELISLLDYPDEVKNAHSRLDSCFFRLVNSIQSCSCPTEVIIVIDKLLQYISEHHDDVGTTNIGSLITSVLDMIVGLCCLNFFNTFQGSPALAEYQCSLTNAMQKLMNYIPMLQKRTNLHMADETLTYYRTCHELMTDFDCHPDSFDRKHNELKAWKNMNHCICTTALLTFVQSWHIYMVSMQNPASTYGYSCLVPKMEYLSSQIKECALIPNHTFRLCLYAYIASSMVQYCQLSTNKAFSHGTLLSPHVDDIAELFKRTSFPKEKIDEYTAIAECLVPYFTEFPS